MANISDIREPQDPDAREASRSSKSPFSLFRQLDDQAAEALLREILSLRRQALREDRDVAEQATNLAKEKATVLIEGVAGWAFYGLASIVGAPIHHYADISPRMRRKTIAAMVRHLPLLTTRQRAEISEALDSLEWGEVLPLLAPGPKRPRPLMRQAEAAAALDMLAWIRRQVGLGVAEAAAVREVAEATGAGSDAVQLWRDQVADWFDEEVVQVSLGTQSEVFSAVFEHRI